MKSLPEVREMMVERLRRDLIGPADLNIPDEVLKDYPTDRYLTGILYPRQSQLSQQENDELGSGDQDNSEGGDDTGVSLSRCIRPASAGISFMVAGQGNKSNSSISIEVRAARYDRLWTASENSEELTDEPQKGRDRLRWRRVEPKTHPLELPLADNVMELDEFGFMGLQLFIRTASTGKATAVTVVLINTTPAKDDREENELATWFQTGLHVKAVQGAKLCGRPMRKTGSTDDDRTAELIYRDAIEFATGHTCSADWGDIDNDHTAGWVGTEWMPSRIVEATSTKGDEVFEPLRNHDALKPLSAEWLASAGKNELISALRMLPEAYGKWIEKQDELTGNLSDALAVIAKEHRKLWVRSKDRMTSALTRLDQDANVLKAFQLANRAMAKQRKWSRGDNDLYWYPFQLAFQLMVLESTLFNDHVDRDTMDLLWFPTGGGKTEAYLVVIATLLFHRRLSRKSPAGAGVSVIMRYTLRVLTTQQFERAATLICASEVIRQKEYIDPGGDPFSIGLWVGGDAVPNKVGKAHADSENRALQIPKCPCCKARLDKTEERSKYSIRCLNEECELAKACPTLPIWTVDDDIYEVTPSLLIGTIDKFAQIARNNETGKLFGIATKHDQPDLIIQDELHLISGPLGTIAGLYECAIDAFCMKDDNPVKIIGSTATIKMADRQVLDLFNRRVYQFPPPGIDAANSGFAVRVDGRDRGRLYVGLSTAGRSAKFTLQAACASLLQAASAPGIPANMDDSYWTLVCYFNSLRELGGAHVMMLDDVPKSMGGYASRHGESPRKVIEPVELTSRLSQAEIPQILEDLKKDKQSGQSEDILLATNMISVGVDIPRLALMVVNGQPKAISEYIQATSRVGRDVVPGLVISVFNNGKPRDRSHYETFSSWHGTLYRDVEPTSVTPFAPRALDKALHAVLVALARHLATGMRTRPRIDPAKRAKIEALAARIIDRAGVIDPPEKPSVENKIKATLDDWERRSHVKQYWNERMLKKTLMISAEKHATQRVAGRKGITPWPAPNSMRDVEPSVKFLLAD